VLYNHAMRRWNLLLDEPLSLRIAADARWTQVEPGYDQIWELAPGEEQPRAMSLRTTYGQRVPLMHIFPGFRLGDQLVLDPERFFRPPRIHTLLPDYIEWSGEPFEGLQVVSETWASAGQVLEGAYTVLNTTDGLLDAGLRLHAVLQPLGDQAAMGEREMAGVTVLVGRASDLEPVLFLSGGGVLAPTPYPALSVQARLQPGLSRTWRWVHCGGREAAQAFATCRERMQVAWEPQIASLKLRNSALIDIRTGDERRDVALWLAQRDTLQCLASPTRYARKLWARPHRIIRDGHTEHGRPRPFDSSGEARGQIYAALQLLPGQPELAQGILENLLARQGAAAGRESPASGLEAGQIGPPYLCYLARALFERTGDEHFLQQHFAELRGYLESWFSPRRDRDGDGIPEWDHVLQAGFEDWPAFSPFFAWAQGYEISKAETIDLAAALYRECKDLLALAEVVGESKACKQFEARAERLKEMVEASWSPRKASFQHRDRDLHSTPRGGLLARGRGSFRKEVGREFEVPVRALLRILGPDGAIPKFRIRVGSRGLKGRARVERYTERHFRWFWGIGSLTSEKPSKAIEYIEVDGLPAGFRVELHAGDLAREDVTTLLPLWAGMLDSQRAETLVQRTLLDEKRYWRRSGIPSCSARDKAYAPDGEGGSGPVDMFWNALLGEGLLACEARGEAAELADRLIQAGMGALQEEAGFCARYHADEPLGVGEAGSLTGSPPLKLFLDALGVELMSPQKVRLLPGNPFPYPVRLIWRGLEVRSEADLVWIRFPDGEEVEISKRGRHIVEQIG